MIPSSALPRSLPTLLLLLLLLILLPVPSRGSVAPGPRRYPRIVHPRVIPRSELSRDRRSVPGPPDLEFVALNDWILRTEPNRRLRFSPGFVAEWPGAAVGAAAPPPSLRGCESREGEVQGRENDSRAIVTRCADEFFGLVDLDGRTYLVEPLPGSRAREHLLYEAEFARARREAAAGGAGGASLVYEARRGFYNLSGDTFAEENYEDSPGLLGERSELGRNNELEGRQEEEEEEAELGLGYFYDRSWERERLPTRKTANSKLSSPKWLELAIVADHSVIDFHGSRVQQYVLALLNIVSAIYKDPTLDANMQLVIVRMIFYTDRRDGMVQQGNARRSLENVNKWNRKLLAATNGTTHDLAVWLTRLDIGGPSGYAPVSGACDPSRSCALNRDEGLTSAFIIAHEVAHILGLSHDGDKNSGNACAREAAQGSIMAPMVAATFHNFHWSTCSRKEFHRRAKLWTCLLNRPSDDDSPLASGSVNEIFSMDEQCRMEFGEGYSRCRNLDSSNLCAHLWCGRANLTTGGGGGGGGGEACRTKKGPPLEGTLCAENKWCLNGRCEPIDEKRYEPTPLAVRGKVENSWGSWGSWSECSRSCGVAVQHRTRHCAGFCKGESREFRLCELPACSPPDGAVDLRARQCARFFQEHALPGASGPVGGPGTLDRNATWLPYEAFDGAANCQLVCYKEETGEIFHTGTDVEDGTPCSYETSDICVYGACRPMGCDGRLGSSRARDACGLCDGGNSTCENVADKFQRKLRRETTRLAVLPRSAHNVKVVVTILLTDSVPHEGNVRILVRDGGGGGGGARRRHELGGEFDAEGRAPVAIIEGAAFRLERLHEKYVLWSRGPLAAEIVVSLLARREVIRSGASISASSQYAIGRSELRAARGRYVWAAVGPAGPCSASCGGGLRRRQLVCRDEATREPVSRGRCLALDAGAGGGPAAARRRFQLERCNTGSCDYVWIPGMWERCSSSSSSSVSVSATGAKSPEPGPCGPAGAGVQQRRLYCVRAAFPERQVTRENELRVYRNTVPPAKCRDLRQPPTERACNRAPVCAGQWVYGDWSPCSQSCGRGVQTRRARCVELPTAEYQRLLLDSCNATRAPDEVRACKGPARHGPECGRPCHDRGGGCKAHDLVARCKSPAFRKRCCSTCRGV